MYTTNSVILLQKILSSLLSELKKFTFALYTMNHGVAI